MVYCQQVQYSVVNLEPVTCVSVYHDWTTAKTNNDNEAQVYIVRCDTMA